MKQMSSSIEWKWPLLPNASRIAAIDLHTGGEPLRVITGGLPPLPGRTVLEKRGYFREHLDHLRTGLMWEPRGHADMYGAVITPSEDADFDVFFLHNEGYSTMCGHAIIALTTLVLEAGPAPFDASIRQPAADREVQLSAAQLPLRNDFHRPCATARVTQPQRLRLRRRGGRPIGYGLGGECTRGAALRQGRVGARQSDHDRKPHW